MESKTNEEEYLDMTKEDKKDSWLDKDMFKLDEDMFELDEDMFELPKDSFKFLEEPLW